MAHNSKSGPCTDCVGHRRPVIQHGNEASVGTAEPRFRKDIMDKNNDGPSSDQGVGAGDGAAPGSSGAVYTPPGEM
jgi:hypothetical protein